MPTDVNTLRVSFHPTYTIPEDPSFVMRTFYSTTVPDAGKWRHGIKILEKQMVKKVRGKGKGFDPL